MLILFSFSYNSFITLKVKLNKVMFIFKIYFITLINMILFINNVYIINILLIDLY